MSSRSTEETQGAVTLEQFLLQLDQCISQNIEFPTDYLINDRRSLNQPYYQDLDKNIIKCLETRANSYLDAAIFLLDWYDCSIAQKSILTQELKSIRTSANFGGQRLTNQWFNHCVSAFAKHIHTQKLTKKYSTAFEDLLRAENILNWQRKNPIVVTITKFSEANHTELLTIVQFDIPLIHQTKEQTKHLLSCLNADEETRPTWFQALPNWEQAYWRQTIEETQGKINQRLGTQPSTFRYYPGLANAMLHGIVIYNTKHKREIALTRFRSSIISPPNTQMKNETVRQQIGHQNLNQLAENYQLLRDQPAKVLLAQTLLTSLDIPIFGHEKKMLEDKRKATISFSTMNDSLQVIETNYAVNDWSPGSKKGAVASKEHYAGEIDKIINCCLMHFQRSNLKNCQSIEKVNGVLKSSLGQAQQMQYIADMPSGNEVELDISKESQDDLLAKETGLLVNCLKLYLTLHNNHGTKNAWHGELLPALEEIVVALLDNSITHASCKSGKDRRAMLLMLEDSLIIFHQLFKHVEITSTSSQSKKDDLAKLYVNLFSSGHQQIMAELNARGCYGLKAITEVLPTFISDELKKFEGMIKHNSNSAKINRPEKVAEKKAKQKASKSIIRGSNSQAIETVNVKDTQTTSLLFNDLHKELNKSVGTGTWSQLQQLPIGTPSTLSTKSSVEQHPERFDPVFSNRPTRIEEAFDQLVDLADEYVASEDEDDSSAFEEKLSDLQDEYLDLNLITDADGQTILHYVAAQSHSIYLEIVASLLIYGLDPEKTDYYGNTAVELAESGMGNHDIAAELKKNIQQKNMN